MTATTFAAAVMLSGMLVWPPAPPHSAQPGPPQWLLAFDGRSVSRSACMPHACPTKGVLWLDLTTGTALEAIPAASDFPGCLRAEFTQQVEALRNWLPRSARP